MSPLLVLRRQGCDWGPARGRRSEPCENIAQTIEWDALLDERGAALHDKPRGSATMLVIVVSSYSSTVKRTTRFAHVQGRCATASD